MYNLHTIKTKPIIIELNKIKEIALLPCIHNTNNASKQKIQTSNNRIKKKSVLSQCHCPALNCFQLHVYSM